LRLRAFRAVLAIADCSAYGCGSHPGGSNFFTKLFFKDLALLAEEYKDEQLLQQTTKPLDRSATKARDVVKTLCKNRNSDDDDCEASPLAVTLSRILVCKPHSADCKRLISAYNRLKTDSRCRLDNETVKNYLYILLNMPPLANYDPRPAVTYWLQEKSRRHKATPRASQQQWLSNVFEAEQEVEAHKNGKQKLVRKF